MTVKKYVAAALTIGIAIGPASALDVGGKVGGLGVSAGVSAGSQGASVGVGASVGGVGGANVGASVGAGNVGVSASGNVGSASVSAGGNVGSTGGGLSTGVGLGADPSAENGSAAAASGSAATAASGSAATATATTATARTARPSIALPPVLRPSRAGQGDLTRGYPFAPLEALKAKPGTPVAVVQACRAAILSAAKPLGAVRVRAVSAGALRRRGGALTAPIQVRIDYAGRGGIEIRQAQVGCRLDAAGRVIAVK